MSRTWDYLALSDEELLAQCDVDVYRASGPGGQHRNKASTAVRLRHRPTGLSAHGDESRSQFDNKRQALRRLRGHIACAIRRPVEPVAPPPEYVTECMFIARGGPAAGKRRLRVGPKDRRFWRLAAYLLDVLEHFKGALGDAADHLGISVNNLSDMLKSHRHLLTAAQRIRQACGLRPIH